MEFSKFQSCYVDLVFEQIPKVVQKWLSKDSNQGLLYR